MNTAETKPLVASKTFWLNLLTLVIVIANHLGHAVDPALADRIAVVVVTLVNTFLRVGTTSKKIKGLVS